MDDYQITRGGLEKYRSDGSYRGKWDDADGTAPAVGDHVTYDRVGDQIARSFLMPEVGGQVVLTHRATAEVSFRVGTAEFRRCGAAHTEYDGDSYCNDTKRVAKFERVA